MSTSRDEDEYEYTYNSIREESERLARMESLMRILLILPFVSTFLLLVIAFVLLSR
ncbi:MAG: hypothetical protein RMJ59_03020 [Candidatus Nitrosocaldus sp.]|nr:hypothetical protein [Candidatus Nitrosocaldus sp.]MDW8275342.1 hypothetical protein [Candidatus Nitrosocaldus sp.]